MVTIKDVAKQAGVSSSTVSHVINDTRYVSDELKARVLSSMEDLSYQPNRIARSLRKKQTNTIGLIISDITNPFFSEIASSIEYLTFLEKYSLILCSTNGKQEKETFYINQLSEWRVDGIILISPKISISFLKILDERNIPVVLIDNESPGGEIDVISGVQCADVLFEKKEKPTAIFACNDLMAVGVIKSASAHNLRVPEDLSVIGFDDISLMKYIFPPLTTIKQPMREIGEQAINCMMEIIKNPNKACRTITLNVRLEERQSTQMMKKEQV